MCPCKIGLKVKLTDCFPLCLAPQFKPHLPVCVRVKNRVKNKKNIEA